MCQVACQAIWHESRQPHQHHWDKHGSGQSVRVQVQWIVMSELDTWEFSMSTFTSLLESKVTSVNHQSLHLKFWSNKPSQPVKLERAQLKSPRVQDDRLRLQPRPTLKSWYAWQVNAWKCGTIPTVESQAAQAALSFTALVPGPLVCAWFVSSFHSLSCSLHL